MKRNLIIWTLILSLFIVGNVSASNTITVKDSTTKLTTKKSALRGRVLNALKAPLPGATIIIDGTTKGAISDEKGYFYISNITPGDHDITVSYVGYEDLKKRITFKTSTVAEVEIIFTESMTIEQITVKGIVSGRAKSIQQQKNEVGVTNIVSSDQMERFPDDNIGDALKRIQGINVQYDQGEARFVQVRGTSPELSSVTLNGNRTPSAEGETRSAQLDLIPSDMIQTVEVRKVVTADMDGDAIGGAINLITKSAPSQSLINGSFSTGYNAISGKMNYNGSLTFGTRLFDDKFGVIGAVSYMNNPFGSDNIEAEWDMDKNDDIYINDFQVRQYYVQRERQSYSLSADYIFSPNHKIEAKALFNRRNDWENRYRLSIKDIEKNSAGTYEGELRYETKGGVEDNKYTRLEQQQTETYNIAGEHKFSRLEMDWNIDYSKAFEKRPHERYVSVRQKGVELTHDISNASQPIINAADPSVLDFTAANFDLKEFTEEFQDINEDVLIGALDFKLDLLRGEFANVLRFGYKYQNKNKNKEKIYYEYELIDEAAYVSNMFGTASNYSNQTRDNYLAGDYKAGTYFTKEFLGGVDFSDNAIFKEGKHNLEEEAGNYTGEETIHAGYLRLDQRLSSTLSLIAGVRFEQTGIHYTGFDIDYDKDELKDATPNDRKMTNVLPSFILKYTPKENMIIRAAFTSTLARPKFSYLAPGDTFNDEDYYRGNPNLRNTVSNNFDLMFEYYTKGAGMITAGLYYKDIKDFIIEGTVKDYEYGGTVWDKFVQPLNAGNGYLFGAEVAFQKDLGFISSSLKNFGLYANYTYTKSQVTKLVENEPLLEGQKAEDLTLPGSPEHIANLSLYYENKRISAALSYNFASSFLDELGESAFYNRYYDKVNYLDFNISVRANKWITVFGEINNILNQPLRYYQGVSEQVMQLEYYGSKAVIGIRYNF